MLVLGAYSLVNAPIGKQKVGATEQITVLPSELNFVARVDTGAKTTSLHAVDIVAANGLLAGEEISFTTFNIRGESRQIISTIDSLVQVNTSEGGEQRIKIPLTLEWRGKAKTVLAAIFRVVAHFPTQPIILLFVGSAQPHHKAANFGFGQTTD